MRGVFQEMSSLNIKCLDNTYSVTIGKNLLSGIHADDCIVLADNSIMRYVSGEFERIITLEASESTKTLLTCESVMQKMKEIGANRKTLLVAIGGGYIQDIATLTASLFMRGIKWQYVPTTATAILDSCIGGKSSINCGGFKNLIGNIYPPTNVLIDLGVTKSLNPIAIACGLSEAIKICYARGHKEFQVFVDLYRDFKSMDSVTGEDLIEHVLKSKQWFIEEDEFDTGIRQLLNFGHTFGHALEAATSFSVPHGIAVSLGMLSALNFDEKLNSQPEINLSMEIWKILQPVKIQAASQVKIFNDQSFKNAFTGDKKHIDSKFRLILSSNGELKIKEIERNSENLEKALIAIKSVMDDLSKNEK
jgi:3-dehydroquinate synthase